MKQIEAKVKYLLSFFKSEWDFKDYPLETWTNTNAEHEEIRFGASFTNWALFVAHGISVSHAIKNLKMNLVEYRKENKLPRPGSNVPIQYTDSNKIELYEEIAVDFFEKIIGMNYFDCFISDMSSLFDFELDNKEIIEKIKNEYGITPEKDLFLGDIFEQISNKSSA